ncbi:MAG: prephenate dehydratase [Gammaproteobacteria bacterium]|jgi:chorismate mutase/prephenate dehydratase|nr:prephenate dehydratase [Gammaproteobacteria bacterium]MDP6096322.1 prephenate dehydratase [Gammaproteobacteria bacterium]HJO12239.1 prephenate dehydratase [Gammaproteobacteria bacterium]|tara:strand:+ start:3935 stop:4783 length:849 start_codon:yes stop_codon:yes gene_type:complete
MSKVAAQTHKIKPIAYLGPEGTFSQAAVLKQFGHDVPLNGCASIDDVFMEVEAGAADFGVVPVENSTEGAINNTQDCLVESNVRIVGEVIVPIEQNLMLQHNADITKIQTIASHSQSLAQCRDWLSSNWAETAQLECASNAAAAKLASDDNTVAAIAGAVAADIYGLEIAEAQIQDQKHNSTRFLVLANSTTQSSGSDKTSILIYTENKPGALFRVLEPFEMLQVSLTKIETRPSKKEVWEYVFFIDFEGHVDDEVIQQLFTRLGHCSAEIKVLGSYPSAIA